MDVTSATTTQTTTATSQTAQSDAVLTSDFETFLQMLTTQARYQDPLEPIDSSEYAAQLAQFSMVEQQVKSNEILEAMGTQLGSGTMTQMAGWIGMEARTTAPIAFDGSPITIQPKAVSGADEAVLVVYNAAGSEVQRQAITTTGQAVQWAGFQNDGSQFPEGQYSFAVESSLVGEVFSTDKAETYSRVVEARREGTETNLILQGGASVQASDVTALREPV